MSEIIKLKLRTPEEQAVYFSMKLVEKDKEITQLKAENAGLQKAYKNASDDWEFQIARGNRVAVTLDKYREALQHCDHLSKSMAKIPKNKRTDKATILTLESVHDIASKALEAKEAV